MSGDTLFPFGIAEKVAIANYVADAVSTAESTPAAGSVGTAALASSAVTAPKIAVGAIVDAAIASNAAIASSKIANVVPTAYAADGAISPTAKVAVLSKAGVGAYTLAAGADGAHLYITSTTANAHVVTATSLINDGVTGAPHSTLTFAAFPGATIHLVSYGSKWNVVAKNVVTVS